MLPHNITNRKSVFSLLVIRGSKQVTMRSKTTTSWVRSDLLQRALPQLTLQFDTYKDKNNRFPIFDSKQTKKAFQPFLGAQTNKKEAAILIPLISIKEVPYVLFTLRSSKIKSHPSQISFPGGHADNCTDNNLIETALRETQEEIMMDSTYPPLQQQQRLPTTKETTNNGYDDGIHIIGKCTAVPSIKGTPVTSVIGVYQYDIPHDNVETVFPGYNPDEVEKVFAVSVQELLQCETSETLPRLGSHAPAFPTKKHGKIWGLTAICLRPVLHKILKPVFCP